MDVWMGWLGQVKMKVFSERYKSETVQQMVNYFKFNSLKSKNESNSLDTYNQIYP